MKKSEIVVGGVYSDGKNGVRKVLAFGGEELKYYQSQKNTQNLQCLIIQAREKKLVGQKCNNTVVSFAAWAKERIS